MLDISEQAERRFSHHLRRWNNARGSFVDEEGAVPEAGDAEGTCWALPVVFIGRYDPVEDDFIGNTFLAHPEKPVEAQDGEEAKLGPGQRTFTREHKRLCGFLFLRTLRTGARALSLQRGSLLDTILRLGGPDSTSLREIVRFFVASEQSGRLIPFQRLGTGAINMLVFALLTFIAELKEKQSVIFAMEEPEIALPPHTQRRVVRFSLREMSQTVITSHSPYVIEQFEPEQIVMLKREAGGALSGKPVDTKDIKPKPSRPSAGSSPKRSSAARCLS